MSYTRFHDAWQDAVYDSRGVLVRASTTPVTAEFLQHLEDGLVAAGGVLLGTTAGTACEGNDGRLSDARTPKAHAASHGPGAADDLSSLFLPRNLVGAAGGAAAFGDSRLSDARDWKLFSGTPSNGQVPSWNGTQFVPATPASTGSGSVADASTTGKGVVQLAGDLAGTAAAPTVPALTSKAPTSRQMTAGAGLTGGGDLTADRSFAVAYGAAAGTAAQGNDPRLSDQRTPTAHAASHASGGSDAITPASIGAPALDSSGLVPLNRLPPRDGLYPLSEYGLTAATLHPDACVGSSGAEGASRLGLYRLWIPAGVAINGLVMYCTVVGASLGSGTVQRLAVYSDAGALVGSSADDTSLFSTTGPQLRALTSAIAAQAAGRFVYAGFVHQFATAPKVFTAAQLAGGGNPYAWKVSGGAIVTGANLRAQVQTGVTASLPVSFTPAAASADYPLAFVGVY